MTIRQPSEVDSLLDVSARIGGNPLLVQAGTGNTSVKLDRTLWIKASGKWLAHAKHDDMLVPVDLAEVLACLRQNRDLTGVCQGAALKPSIETFMHAVLPQRVVIHVHSVNTIAWAVRQDGPLQAAQRLAGLRWRWIPYVSSGRPLAVEIENALAVSPGTEIFILANHGLVVCGDSASAAEALLDEVEKRLTIQPRRAPPPDYRELSRVADATSWCLPDSEEFHPLGTDEISRRTLSRGTLYPCQAIFFGADMPASFAIVDDAGVVFHKDMTRTQEAMLAGLVHVVQRIEASAPVCYLTAPQVEHAMSVEACKYRAQVESWSTPDYKRSNGQRCELSN